MLRITDVLIVPVSPDPRSRPGTGPCPGNGVISSGNGAIPCPGPGNAHRPANATDDTHDDYDAPAPASRLLAYASFLIAGGFRVSDVRIVSARGCLLVAMPSRKLTDRCRHCNARVALAARFCPACGARHPEGQGPVGAEGRPVYFADVAHPVTAAARAEVERAVLGEYRRVVREAGTTDATGGVGGDQDAAGATDGNGNGAVDKVESTGRVGVLPARRRA
jgi:DNA-binding cell septation regulator SpoVG